MLSVISAVVLYITIYTYNNPSLASPHRPSKTSRPRHHLSVSAAAPTTTPVQITSLEALWPKLAWGGVFIVEDLTVGALPWLRGEALQDQIRRSPTANNNSECKSECHYVQKPAEHPFIKRLLPNMASKKEAEEALRRGAG